MPESFITQYERATVAHIESVLTNKKVKLWADAFNTDNTAKTRNMVFFGHQKTDRYNFVRHPETNAIVYLKRYYLEIRVEIYTLVNHQEALDLIETILDEVLLAYTPFYEFLPFIPEQSGNASRNNRVGSWIYSGSGYTEISSDVEELTPIPENPLPGRIIQVGLFNAQSEDNSQIGIFTKEDE